MKNNLTRKLWSLIMMSVLLTSSLMMAIPELAKATNTNAWQEITPRRTTTSPALGDNDHQYLGQPGNGAKYTSFVDVLETKPNGAKVFHYFYAMPMAYPWQGSMQTGSVYHSSNQGLAWNKINPTNWGTAGGSIRITLKAVDQIWTDAAGSQWNKKVFMLTNNNTYFTQYDYGYYYYNYRPSLYRYDGNGTNTTWNEIYSDTAGLHTVGTPSSMSIWSYGYGSRMFMEVYKGKLYFVNYLKNNNQMFDGNYRIRIFRSNTTTLAELCNNNTIAWTSDPQDYMPPTYNQAWNNGAPISFAFRKAGDYLYLSTPMNNNPYGTNIEGVNGMFFRSDANGTNWTQAPSPGPATGYAGAITSNLSNGTGSFQLQIGGVWYTAYYTYPTTAFMIYGGDYRYYICYMNWGYWGGYFQNRTVGFRYSSRNDTTKQIWVTLVAEPNSMASLAGGPAPLSLEYFKGYLYAGYGNTSTVKLRRTNVFAGTPGLDHANWTDCGAIQAPEKLPSGLDGPIRTQSYAVTTLGKTSFKDQTGTMQDVNLYIGGAQGPGPYNTGFGALFFTQGFNSAGVDGVPLKYSILEDEWRYTKTSSIGSSSAYRNQIYDFYDAYPGSLGLIVQFCASNTRPLGDGFGGTYNQRKVHLYNAPPSCDVKIIPEPVINERGTDTDVSFQFNPIGGFGPGNVKVTLELPPNVFLPTKDSNNLPINRKFNTPTPMNGGVLQISATIRSTNAATVKKYLAKVTIEDLVLGITIVRYFEFIVVYPKPGYSASVSPSVFELYQGTCPPSQCCSESCQQISVDLVSRNDFEDNVIVGVNWIDKPPSNDVTLQWQQSTFIYDFIDDKTIEAITRKNIGTRYLMQVKVTPNTTVGTWKFKMFFISGLLKTSRIVQFTVGPAKPGIKITSNPSVIRVVPGAIASYRLLIESLNGFVGKVNLTLQNLPPNVTVLSFRAELPPPGYPDNYVDISPGNPAYANLVIQTYSITTAPTNPRKVTIAQVNEKLNSVSWDFSFKGSYPIAGYEIWRATSQFIDTAVKLGTVNSGTNSFDDNTILRDKSYFYFVRAFDTQIPPNYSSYTSSGEFKTTSTNIFGTISNEGTLPGFNNIEILGQGVGFGPNQDAVAPVGLGISVLHIYEQVQNMATPAFTWWSSLLLLISMLAVFLLLNSKKEKKTSN